MPGRKRYCHVVSLLFDGVVIVSAFTFGLWCSWDFLVALNQGARVNPSAELWGILLLAGGPLAGVVWIQFRVLPAIHALAARGRREQLAVTLLPAEDFLAPRLRRPVALAVAAPAAMIPSQITCLVAFVTIGNEWILSMIAYLLATVAILLWSVSGALIAMTGLCGSTGGEREAFSIMRAVGGIFCLSFLFLPCLGMISGEPLMALVTMAFLCLGAVMLFNWRWEQACRAYYTFE